MFYPADKYYNRKISFQYIAWDEASTLMSAKIIDLSIFPRVYLNSLRGSFLCLKWGKYSVCLLDCFLHNFETRENLIMKFRDKNMIQREEKSFMLSRIILVKQYKQGYFTSTLLEMLLIGFILFDQHDTFNDEGNFWIIDLC